MATEGSLREHELRNGAGCFQFVASGRGSIEVSMLGYYNKSKSVLSFSDSRKDTLDIGDIELKMSPLMLKMAVSHGTASSSASRWMARA